MYLVQYALSTVATGGCEAISLLWVNSLCFLEIGLPSNIDIYPMVFNGAAHIVKTMEYGQTMEYGLVFESSGKHLKC